MSQSVQLLNREEEVASMKHLKDENEKLEAKVKVSSGKDMEITCLRERESKYYTESVL